MRPYLLLLLLFCHLPIRSQVTYLYPVKQGHKWGYMDKKGRLVVEPQYDAVGDVCLPFAGKETESPYRLVEKNGKLGLINSQCKEVLPARFDHIVPLDRKHFIVRNNDTTKIINDRGETALQGSFEAIRLLDTLDGHLFKTKTNGLWGVQKMDKGEVLPAIYEDLQLQRAGGLFFKTKKTGKGQLWGLVDEYNQTILPHLFSDIRVISPTLFATLENGIGWTIRNQHGMAVLSNAWRGCTPLNSALVCLDNGFGTVSLFSVPQMDTLPLSNRPAECRPFSENHVRYRNSIDFGLMDNNGNVAINAVFENILPGFDSLFLVKCRLDGWGVFSLSRGLILPCLYDEINRTEGPWIKANRAGLWGLLDTSFREVIPPAFDRLTIADTLIKAFADSSLTLFKVMPDGQVALLEEFSNVRSLRIGYNQTTYMEALPIKAPKPLQGSVLDQKASPFTSQSQGRWHWYRDTQTKRWGLRDNDTRTEPVPPGFLDVLHLRASNLSMVLTDAETSPNNYDLLPAFHTVSVFPRAAIFNHETGQFVSAFDLLALRGGDLEEGLPFAVFLDKNGRFGLIDKNGREARSPDGQPLRFTWIGHFADGRARFCSGGKLALAEEGKPSKTGIGTVGDFMLQFGLHTSQSYSSIEERVLVVENTPNSPVQWGYLNENGQVAISAQYNFAGDFENGFAVGLKGGNWGVVRPDGSEHIPFKYSSISRFYSNWLVGAKSAGRLVFNPNGHERVTKIYQKQGEFRENRCRVEMDSLWGYMDEEGNEVIPCQYQEARDFSEGLAAVFKDGAWGFILPDGQTAFSLQLPDGQITAIGDFSEGLAWFRAGFKYGYLNKNGQVAIAPDFTKVFDFKNGVARAVFRGKTGLIGTTGQWILKPERFEYITDFNQWGVAEAREKFKGKSCLIHANGEVLTPLKYDYIGTFREGFAKIGTGQYFGLLDARGKEVLPLAYAAVGEVSEGLVAVRPQNSPNWHFVDTLGQKAFAGEFVQADPFQSGHSFVQENHFDPTSRYVINSKGEKLAMNPYDRIEFYESGIFGFYTPDGQRDGLRRLNYYYSDASGQPMFDRLFEKIKPFQNGVALVQQSHRWGMINRHGLFVMPPKYPFVNMQDNGEAIVNLPVLFGIVGADETEVFPPVYDHIQLMQGNLYRIEIGEKVGYAKLNGEWVWGVGK